MTFPNVDRVILNAFSFLPFDDLVSASQVNKQWHRLYHSAPLARCPKSFRLFLSHLSTNVDLAMKNYLLALNDASQKGCPTMRALVIEEGIKLAHRISNEELRTKTLYQKIYSIVLNNLLFPECFTLIREMKKQGDQYIEQPQNKWAFDFYKDAIDRLEALPLQNMDLYVELLLALSIYYLVKQNDYATAKKYLHLALAQPNLTDEQQLFLHQKVYAFNHNFHACQILELKKAILSGNIFRTKERNEPLAQPMQSIIEAGDTLVQLGYYIEATEMYWFTFEGQPESEDQLIESKIGRQKFHEANELALTIPTISWTSPRQELVEIRQRVMALPKSNYLGFQMQKQLSNEITALIVSLIGQCERLMGAPPCEYTFLSLGSLSHLGMSLFSDFEFAILLPSGILAHHITYFKTFAKLLELKVIEYGESTPNKDNKLYKKGFAFDDGGNTPLNKEELLGECSNFINCLSLQGSEFQDLILVNSLVEASFLTGQEDLYHQYSNMLKQHLNRNGNLIRKQYVKCILKEAYAKAKEAMGDPPQLWKEGKLDVKSHFYRMISFLTIALSHYYQVHTPSNTLFDRIDILCNTQKLHWAIGDRFKAVLDFAALLRNQAQHFYQQEKDVIFKGEECTDGCFRIEKAKMCSLLEELHETVLVPTFELLKRMTDEYNSLPIENAFDVSIYMQKQLDYAKSILKQNSYEHALELCQRVIECNFLGRNKLKKIAYRMVYKIHYALGRWEKAREAYKKISLHDQHLEKIQKAWELLVNQWEDTPPSIEHGLSYQEILRSEIHPLLLEALKCFANLLTSLNLSEAQQKFASVYEGLFQIYPRRNMCSALKTALQRSSFQWLSSLWCRDGFIFASDNDKKTWTNLLASITKPNLEINLEGMFSRKCALAPHVIQEIIDNGRIAKRYNHGRRNVAYAEKAHFKEDPEFPGMEYAINRLNKLLIGRGSPVHDLCLFTYQAKKHLLLISETIEGMTLRDHFMQDPYFSMDPQEYSLLFFLALLTNPEDGSSRNFIVSNRSITCIDNDHVFVDKVVDEKMTNTRASVKTILYCLAQFDHSFDKNAKTIICQLDFLAILEHWLKDLRSYNTRVFELFPNLSEWYNQKGVFLPIFLMSSLISKMYQKFVRVKSYLSTNPKATHSQLLELVHPNLAILYRQARSLHTNPKAIFSAVSKQAYRLVKNEEISQTTNRQMIELTTGQNAPRQLLFKQSSLQENHVEKSEVRGKSYADVFLNDPNESLNTAQRECDYLKGMNFTLHNIRQNLIQGRTEEFRGLTDEVFYEKVINRIDFSSLSKEVQENIIFALVGKSFRKLCLKGCFALTDLFLVNVLKYCPELYHLDLSGSQITNTEVIFTHCPNLQRLILRKCEKLQTCIPSKLVLKKKNSMPLLHLLDLRDCIHLKEVWVPDQLHELNLNGVTNFRISSGLSLHTLHLNKPLNSITLPLHLSLLFPKLKRLNILEHANKAKEISSTFKPYFQTLEGDSSSVYALTVLPDETIVTGSSLGIIQLWDPLTRKCIRCLKSHTNEISVLAVLPNNTLLSGSWDKTIKLWNLVTWECIRTFVGHTDRITSLSAFTEGTIVSASGDNTVRIWDISTGQCIQTMNGNRVVKLSENIFARALDRLIIVWELVSKKESPLPNFSAAVTSMIALPNKMLAVGTADGQVQLWNTVGECIKTLVEHSKDIYALSVVPNGKLVSASTDKTIILWDLNSGENLFKINEQTNWYSSLATLSDGTIICASAEGSVKLWNKCIVMDLDTIRQNLFQGYPEEFLALKEQEYIEAVIDAIDFKAISSGTEETILKCLPGRNLKKLSLKGISQFTLLEKILNSNPVEELDLSFSTWSDLSIRNYPLQKLNLKDAHINYMHMINLQKNFPRLKYLNVHGCPLIGLSEPYIARFFNKELEPIYNHAEISALPIYSHKSVSALTVLPNGMVVSASEDGLIKIWNPATLKLIQTLNNNTEKLIGLAAFDGNKIVLLSKEYIVQMWDLETVQCLRTFKTTLSRLVLTTLPNGKIVWATQTDNTIMVWYFDGNDPTFNVFNGVKKPIIQTFLDDQMTGLTALPNGTIVIASKSTIRFCDPLGNRTPHDLKVENLICLTAISNDILLYGSTDGTITLYNFATNHFYTFLQDLDLCSMTYQEGVIYCGLKDGSIRRWSNICEVVV